MVRRMLRRLTMDRQIMNKNNMEFTKEDMQGLHILFIIYQKYISRGKL